MSDENEDLAKLMAIVNQEEDEEDEEQLTEEELQQALNSPSIHRHIIDEESTECDDFEMSSGDINANTTANTEESDHKFGEESSGQQPVKQKPGEYQFQMLDHHIFKGKHGKKLYKCDVCYAVYRHSFSLKRHFIRSHINYGYLCETDVTNCGINLSASASLQTWREQRLSAGLSMPSIDMTDLYCCHSCVLFYDQLSQIKGHVDDCHRNNSSGTIEPIRIPCSECNMSFIQRHNLMRHIEVVHNGKRLYACKHCSKKFQTIADRKKHEKSQHQDLSATEDMPRTVTSTTTGHKSTSASHKCIKCSELLSSYAELRKHVNRKHKEFYNACGFCNKFFFSKKQLSAHLRQKHEKTAKDNAKALRQKNKQSTTASEEQYSERSAPVRGQVRSQQMSQQNQYQAYFHCSLCYRRFLTYGSLIRHKQIAHRPQSLRSCSRLTADPQLDTDIIEPFSSGNEFEFYRNLAQKMAENLLYFVDGKSVNPSNDYKVIRNPHHKKIEAVVPDINLQKYNFPEGFRCNPSPPPSANQTEKLEFLFDCNLNTVKNPKFKPLLVETQTTEPLPTCVPTEAQPQKPLYICTACQQKISAELKAEHESNNHPNVKCSYIEIDPQMQNIPQQLLLWQYHCPEGLLQRCRTAPSLSRVEDNTKQSLNCTKCQMSFPSVSLLHNHILDCAHNSDSKKKLSNNSNKSHNNAETQTLSTANTSTTSNTTIANTSSSDSQTEPNTSHSSEATEKDFSSPLSPCKTRSGKRRQISPEDYVKTKRTRNASKNSSNDSKASQKSNTQSSGAQVVVKIEDIIDNSDKPSDKSDQKSSKSSPEPTATPESSKNSKTVPKNLKDVSKDDNQSFKSGADSPPKRYSCKKCSKKFVYMDSLSKHQMSCNKRVFTSKVNTKRELRKSTKISQKLSKNIELKAFLKTIKKSNERQNSIKKSLNTSSTANCSKSAATSGNPIANQLIDDDSKDKTEEEDYEEEETDGKDVTDSAQNKETEGSPKSSSKRLNSDKSVLQEHQCPDCLRVFAYVANFRKHITSVCPVRKQLSVDESDDSDSTPTTSTPKSGSKELNEVIVIKEEKPDLDGEDMDCSEIKDVVKEEANDDEVVFDGETRGEPEEDTEESASPKDESKLDLWRVKQENPQFAFKGSPAQHHSCPYCHRGFTYLANYRKHIKSICPIRIQIDEKKKKVIEENGEQDSKAKADAPAVIYTPSSLSVRSQIEDTVLSLLRDQTKQDQILQSSEALIKSKSESTSPGVRQSDSTDTELNKSNEKSDSNPESKTQELDKTKDDITKDSTHTNTPSKGSTFKFRTFSCSICHKIFLSYVTMLKHRLSHKLSDGSLNSNEENSSNSSGVHQRPSMANKEADNLNNSELNDANGERAESALASTLLKRSREVVFNKMRLNSALNASAAKNAKKGDSGPKAVINTTDLLEKLARGGITTQTIEKTLNSNQKSSTKGQEVITIETNNNNTNILNLQLSASTSSNTTNNLKTNDNNNGLEDIIIDANDLELNVLKDGVIMSEDLQQLIAVNDGKEVAADELPVNEVLLNLDDIENGNEVWITITDSSAYVQVPNSTPNSS